MHLFHLQSNIFLNSHLFFVRSFFLLFPTIGFCPSEAGGDEACLGGMGDDFDMPPTPM
jgi:hypothetical protein